MYSNNVKISLGWNRLRHTSSLMRMSQIRLLNYCKPRTIPGLTFFSTSVVEAISCDTCKCRVSLTLNQYVRRSRIFYRTYNYVTWKARVERHNKYGNLRNYCILLFILNHTCVHASILFISLAILLVNCILHETVIRLKSLTYERIF